MKTLYRLLLSVSLLVVTVSCSKTDIAPQPETQDLTVSNDLRASSCPDYFYYQGNTPYNLGQMFTDKIIVGFKKGTNTNNKNMVIAGFPQLKNIIEVTQPGTTELTIVSLKPGISCKGLKNLLSALPSNPHVDFAGGYFNYEYFPGARIGIANTFVISLKANKTLAHLENLMKRTKTIVAMDLGFGMYVMQTTKQSPKSCLEITNKFYESGLCETAEPDFLFEFPPMP
jgi:hypothetical protein